MIKKEVSNSRLHSAAMRTRRKPYAGLRRCKNSVLSHFLKWSICEYHMTRAAMARALARIRETEKYANKV